MDKQFVSGRKQLAVALALALSASCAHADPLEEGFARPPNAAKPRVWWHWMNGNVSKEGIKLDLEWMQRVGIGGFQNFDAALRTPQLVARRLVYMTPEWQDAFRYAVTTADRIGMEIAIASSAGWSESGGPWVTPQQAMKKVVWSETVLTGGQPFNGVLAAPPSVSGPFQNVPVNHETDPGDRMTPPDYYADTVVMAYRLPDDDADPVPVSVTASAGSGDPALLSDGDPVKTYALPIPRDKKQAAWILFDYGQPRTMRALTFARHDASAMDPYFGTSAPSPALEASDDGVVFRPVATVPAPVNDGTMSVRSAQTTIAFEPVSARYFRAVFKRMPAVQADENIDATAVSGDYKVPRLSKNYGIAELALHTGGRIHRFEDKAAFASSVDVARLPAVAVPDALAVPAASVVDLTARMAPGGRLNWTPPEGRWLVLRFGYSLTGSTNGPASPEGSGLEVDKLNATHVRSYLDHYLGQYQRMLGGLMGRRGLRYMVNDSWEAGLQNWTDDMLAEFARRRGYDARPWLPALTGRIIGSAEASDKFLWDYRQTLADLVSENHHDVIAAALHERGMGGYAESHEGGRALIGDGMQLKRSADVPMGAIWVQKPGVDKDVPMRNADIQESASAAHVYGKQLVAAESFTAGNSAWGWSPATLKPTADKALALGLNRFVIHSSVHQPLLDKTPGLSLGLFGQWFNRNETWAGQAKSWIDYLARSSFMMQQGQYVADIAYYYGEDSNITQRFGEQGPVLPSGYAFDYINPDALLNQLHVSDGRLATRSGMRYRVLVLDPRSGRMSLPVLRKLQQLVQAGALVVGAPPAGSPSLADDSAEYAQIVAQLWSADTGKPVSGKVFAGTLDAALSAIGAAPDFIATGASAPVLYGHRQWQGGELYFVNSRSERAEQVTLSFRVRGRVPELWRADSGKRQPLGYRTEGGRTLVTLDMDAKDAVFFVFRKPARAPAHVLPTPVQTTLATLEGPWAVDFKGAAAPAPLQLPQLLDWRLSEQTALRYFSGTAHYVRMIDVPVNWLGAKGSVLLDLGDVHNVAEVRLNGVKLGTLWKPPYRVEVGSALRAGSNRLEVDVTNLWVNRMIGDTQDNAGAKVTFTSPAQFYFPASPLLPSGLLGPVRVLRSN